MLWSREKYQKRARKIGVDILSIDQAHVGTDRSSALINTLVQQLKDLNVEVALHTEVILLDRAIKAITLNDGTLLTFDDIVLSPGRADYEWLQRQIDTLGISYSDNIIDIGIRVETREENYPIVRDYYDPKILFPGKVRTFCINSGSAHIVREKYEGYYSVNGHSLSRDYNNPNGLVNFAMLKTVRLAEPVVSGHFMVKEGYCIIGDGAGTSRGITAAWASGIRAAEGIIG